MLRNQQVSFAAVILSLGVAWCLGNSIRTAEADRQESVLLNSQLPDIESKNFGLPSHPPHLRLDQKLALRCMMPTRLRSIEFSG